MSTAIPSPTQGVWHLGPFPVRAYALCILAGIVVAVWVTNRRLLARGGRPGQALDVAAWAVPFGIVGGRVYHVLTDPELYFAKGRHPLDALRIWEGGLGIWGAIALGVVGAWVGCRRHGVPLRDYIDSAAPGIAVAQAMGRFGNWFNNELYGGRTDLPWGLTIHQWDQSAGRAVLDATGRPVVLGTFHPTFLYEALWCLLVAGVVVLVDRRVGLRGGRAFALYVMLYTIGRGCIELLRTDEANHLFGVRLNVFTAVLVFFAALAGYLRATRRARGAPSRHRRTRARRRGRRARRALTRSRRTPRLVIRTGGSRARGPARLAVILAPTTLVKAAHAQVRSIATADHFTSRGR